MMEHRWTAAAPQSELRWAACTCCGVIYSQEQYSARETMPKCHGSMDARLAAEKEEERKRPLSPDELMAAVHEIAGRTRHSAP